MLPEVEWSSERVGEVTTTLGLGGVPIAGIAGDQQAALFGQLCWSAGEAKNTYGTGCFLLQNIGTEFMRSKHRLITTVAASAQKRLEYAFEGSIFIGGAVVQWLRDNLKIIDASADVEALAASVPDTSGVVFVPAFVGLGAPHWDAHAAGMLIGLGATPAMDTLRAPRSKPSHSRWPMCWRRWTARPARRCKPCASMAALR